MAEDEQRLLPYPYQEALTRAIRTAAEEQERLDYMAIWAGQASRLLNGELSAGELVNRLTRETDDVYERIRRNRGN